MSQEQLDDHPEAGPLYRVNGFDLFEPALPGYIRVGLVSGDRYVTLDVLQDVAAALGRDLVCYTAPPDTDVVFRFTSPSERNPPAAVSSTPIAEAP